MKRIPAARIAWFVPIGYGAFGAITWLVTMASAPRYSFGTDQDMGNPAFWWILGSFAFIGGLTTPASSTRLALGLGVPPLLLSPWTAPRGDNDGLWVLIVPVLGLFTLALMAIAATGARLRRRVDNSRRPGA